MSWFSDLAGRAEALLNQVDQAASESLRDAGFKTPQKSFPPTIGDESGSGPLSYEPTVHTTGPTQGTSIAQVLVGTTTKPSTTKKQQSSGPLHTSTPRKSERKSSVTNDDKLFEFLNTPSKPKEPAVSQAQTQKKASVTSKPPLLQTKSHPVLSQPPGNNSDSSSDPSVKRTSNTTTVSRETVSDSNIPQSEKPSEDIVDTTDFTTQPIPGSARDPVVVPSVDSADSANAVTEHTPQPEPIIEQHIAQDDVSESSQRKELEDLKQAISNYELENKLLKREISSLNQELDSVMHKTSGHEEQVAHYESEIHALREQASRTDHMIRQLRSHDEDLRASLEARDAQLSVLRARLTEADRRVEEQQRELMAAATEKERFLQDANLSSTAHSHALDSLKTQLRQHQTLLDQERVSLQTKQQEFADRESRLQAELAQVRDNLVGQQRQLGLAQAKCVELQNETQRAQQELQLAHREHEEYKLRAAGILQAKEKLLTSLQNGEGGSMGVVSEAQLEEVRLEKEHLQAQLDSALHSVDSLRTELQECEERGSGEVGRLVEQVRVCESVLAEEQRVHALTRSEVTRLTQELEDARESLLREKTAAAQLLQHNESELTALKGQLTSTLSPSRAEQESRLHELTESLIQKQTALETLSVERNSLNLQLQRLKAQLTEAQKDQTTDHHTAVEMNIPEQHDSGARIRPMASVLSSLENAPSDSRLHNVKRAVNTLDKFSIRLGVFLRRYPHARLLALLYMVLLHVWVMVVLLTYTPEAHSLSDNIIPEHGNL